MALQDVSIDTNGMTEIRTFTYLRETLLDDDVPTLNM